MIIRGFYGSPEWRKLRRQVINRYGKVCMCCGKLTRGKETHVDHIQPRSKRRDLELSFENLQILCRKCNDTKSDKHCTDYRPTYPGKTLAGARLKTGTHWSDGYTSEEVLIAIRAVAEHRARVSINL
jgi:5-methylcytosine-specific restriction endonuclease McrA